MKVLNLARFAALAFAATLALPSVASTGNLIQDVNSAIGGDGHLTVILSDDGVATLTGYAEDQSAELSAVNAAQSHADVSDVINLISSD